GRTPSTRRTSRGTVICPLLVILACFSNTSPPRFLTLPHTLLTLKVMLRLRLCNLVAPGTADAQEAVQARGQEGTDGAGIGTVGDYLFQSLPEPGPRHSTGNRYCGSDARHRQIPRLLSGDDLRGFPGGREPGQRQPGDLAEFDDP